MKVLHTLCALLLVLTGSIAAHANTEICMECHGERDLTAERGGKEVSMFVDLDAFSKSAHGKKDCTECHYDVDVEDLPHPERLEPVQCGICHDVVQESFDAGVHGAALQRNAVYAPDCKECHNYHTVLPASDPDSPTFKMKIPILCGKCHREGAPVARVYKISEHNILENYSLSIHGEGLFKKGLLVSATCTDCHRSHMILPHTDSRSSVAPRNIAGTCTQCHIRIEEVHVKIIQGELWEKKPGAIPACSDCHLPHKVRKESLALTLSDQSCLKCHERNDIFKVENGDTISMTVHKEIIQGSVHEDTPCVKCHTDINPQLKRPCKTAQRADCSNCHGQIANEYEMGGHGTEYAGGNKEVPYCTTCHGDHQVKSSKDETSPTFRSAIPQLCGECHREGGKAAVIPGMKEDVPALTDYSQSVHGRSLVERGLLPSAVCSDCHTSHMVLRHTDKRSSVYKDNIPATCASCHRGIYNKYIEGIHFSTDEKKMEELPVCTRCHQSHTIAEVEKDKFMTEVTQQCGSCHQELSETYMQTMHGKAYHLGYLKAARCSDCHEPHRTLNVNDPNSSVGFKNIVETCRKCHEDATMRFTGYLTHATHHDKVKYPILYYTYWAMTILLVSVFTFFGIHTLLWLPRSFRSMFQRRKQRGWHEGQYFFRRFTAAQRITHLFVIISFMSLALTGMMLKFSSMPWARFIADLLGGVVVAGVIHRFAAIITFGYFAFHISTLVKMRRRRGVGWKAFIFDRQSLMFNMDDLRDFFATLKWFFGLGPRPSYGRWTYWEKFDYFAVFWGVGVIGLSGLMLWFPEFFTRFLPGWLINVAHIIHSDEALLAVGFIFTIHFFNTHLRPEAFPMDKVIFTGSIPLEEFKHDRPREFQALKQSGLLRTFMHKEPVPKQLEKLAQVFGFIFLGLGILLIALIIYSVLFGYK